MDLSAFDPAALGDALGRARRSGIVLRTVAEILVERDEAGREQFWRELYDAEAPMWEDIPFATPTPRWSWERYRAARVDSGQIIPDVSVVAYDGGTSAGFTTTGRHEPNDGWTLTCAKFAGLRAMGTTNDEPNKAMRGINAKLGYQMLPARIELEKTL